jgi:hypothetical protein
MTMRQKIIDRFVSIVQSFEGFEAVKAMRFVNLGDITVQPVGGFSQVCRIHFQINDDYMTVKYFDRNNKEILENYGVYVQFCDGQQMERIFKTFRDLIAQEIKNLQLV